jgi:hypothetical protein
MGNLVAVWLTDGGHRHERLAGRRIRRRHGRGEACVVDDAALGAVQVEDVLRAGGSGRSAGCGRHTDPRFSVPFRQRMFSGLGLWALCRAWQTDRPQILGAVQVMDVLGAGGSGAIQGVVNRGLGFRGPAMAAYPGRWPTVGTDRHHPKPQKL